MTDLQDHLMLIGGERRAAASGQWFESEFPYTREPWARVPRGDSDDAAAAVGAAVAAFENPAWRDMQPAARAALMFRLADLIAERADDLAELESRDNGKRISETTGQIRRIPDWYRYFAGLADKVEGGVVPNGNGDVLNLTVKEPMGVVVAITPWNSPLMLAAWKMAPALAAGCTVVLKPSEFTSVTSLVFADLFAEAGFPPGVVNVVTGFGKEIGAALVSDPRIAKVTFTGGPEGGRVVGKLAAEHFHNVSLELGGKSPNIVFADAEIDNAVNGITGGIFAATGQTCIAGSRLLVQRQIHDEVVDKLVTACSDLRFGDPLDPATQMGPVATQPQFDKIMGHINEAKASGARCVLGGHPVEGPAGGRSLFIAPTIFTDVTNSMALARQEIFGPVLAVIPFDGDQDAVAIANDTDYGLAAGLWTMNLRRAVRVSRHLRAGTVWVNTYRQVSHASPFGGYKQSGVGRESGIHAIDEFQETKCIWFNTAEAMPNTLNLR
ncbi:MAG: aldehyde dehydrogenase [Rhodospirillales bacterium]|nr:aldehyde dehydrogenase [Rhodospirillales bacterium]